MWCGVGRLLTNDLNWSLLIKWLCYVSDLPLECKRVSRCNREPRTIYSMLDAGGCTWPRSLLCKSRMRCMSPSLMALLPLDLARHHSSSLSLYWSKRDSSFVELFRTTDMTAWVKHKKKLANLTQPGKGGELLMVIRWRFEQQGFICKRQSAELK